MRQYEEMVGMATGLAAKPNEDAKIAVNEANGRGTNERIRNGTQISSTARVEHIHLLKGTQRLHCLI